VQFKKSHFWIFVRKVYSPSDILVIAPKAPEITAKFIR